jgi:hypothetical protein
LTEEDKGYFAALKGKAYNLVGEAEDKVELNGAKVVDE